MNSLISWWENELSNNDRSKLMKTINYDGWKGTTEERHIKLEEMHNVILGETEND